MNLNTSHVKVNPSTKFILLLGFLYLNTSHVKVNPVDYKGTNSQEIFKYISC